MLNQVQTENATLSLKEYSYQHESLDTALFRFFRRLCSMGVTGDNPVNPIIKTSKVEIEIEDETGMYLTAIHLDSEYPLQVTNHQEDFNYDIVAVTNTKHILEVCKSVLAHVSTPKMESSFWSEIKFDHQDDNGVTHLDGYLTSDDNEQGSTIGFIVGKTLYGEHPKLRSDIKGREVLKELGVYNP